MSDFERIHKFERDYSTQIPQYSPTFEEISKQMKVNADIIIKEITCHVDKELKRFHTQLTEILDEKSPSKTPKKRAKKNHS